MLQLKEIFYVANIIDYGCWGINLDGFCCAELLCLFLSISFKHATCRLTYTDAHSIGPFDPFDPLDFSEILTNHLI